MCRERAVSDEDGVVVALDPIPLLELIPCCLHIREMLSLSREEEIHGWDPIADSSVISSLTGIAKRAEKPKSAIFKMVPEPAVS